MYADLLSIHDGQIQADFVTEEYKQFYPIK